MSSATLDQLPVGVLVAIGAWTVVVIIVDATSRRIPNCLSIPALCAAAGWALFGGYPWALLGGATWWCVAVGLRKISTRAHCGAGDAKLGACLGTAVATVDPMALWVALSASGVLQVAGMLVLGRRGGVGTGTCVRRAPLAPAMMVGAAAALAYPLAVG